MGYSIGWDSTHGRDIGYGVPAVCEHPGCNEEIDRGMGYACGGGFPEDGCGLYFCGKHLFPCKCERCTDGKEPFDPKPDTKEWVEWKLKDESWQRWRDENPEEVVRLTALLDNAELSGPRPLTAEGSRSNDVLERGQTRPQEDNDMDEQERKRFEEWARPDSVQMQRNPENGEYTERGMSAAWAGWQAAVKVEREACAAVCFRHSKTHERASEKATDEKTREMAVNMAIATDFCGQAILGRSNFEVSGLEKRSEATASTGRARP